MPGTGLSTIEADSAYPPLVKGAAMAHTLHTVKWQLAIIFPWARSEHPPHIFPLTRLTSSLRAGTTSWGLHMKQTLSAYGLHIEWPVTTYWLNVFQQELR